MSIFPRKKSISAAPLTQNIGLTEALHISEKIKNRRDRFFLNLEKPRKNRFFVDSTKSIDRMSDPMSFLDSLGGVSFRNQPYLQQIRASSKVMTQNDEGEIS